MKKYFLILPATVIALIMVFNGCKSTSTSDPCSSTGKLCIENKMDSTIVISIIQKHQQITMKKDYMECLNLDANIAYTISISGAGYKKPDTTFLILPCDNKLMVVSQ